MHVTIGLPFANNSSTLPLAIRSIFAQTHTDWELLLLEDGSRDGSADLLEQIRDPRVRLVRDSVNLGLAARLNQVAALAQGKYVARMDADDAMHPDRIRLQVDFLETRQHVDVVFTAAYVIDNDQRVCGLRGMHSVRHGPTGALDHSRWIHPTAVARRAWFEANRYDESLVRSEDYDLWARVYGTSEFAKICVPLFFYREVGVFNLKNYLAEKRADRAIIRRYGPDIIGRGRTELLVLETRLKASLYRLMNALHAENVLVRRRSTPLDDALRVAGEQVLSGIDATPVPGWDRR